MTVGWLTVARLGRIALSVALALALLSAAPAIAAPPSEARWPLTTEKPTPGRDAVYRPPAPDPVDAAAVRGPVKVAWPKAGAAEVSLAGAGPARAGDLPVSVGAASIMAAPSTVRVEVLDRDVTARAQREGLLLRIGRSDGAPAAGRVSVRVDYSGFRHAYGGDWGARLRLVALPDCALSTPERAGCRGEPLPTSNDVAAGLLTADVSASAGGTGTLLAVTAGASGSSGSFAATSLAESATWSAGGSTGDFSWSYPLRVPPSPGGLAPDLALGYSSSSVDGRQPATNNQPSFIGEGFDLWPGYIERRYKPCADDMGGGANNTTKTGDQCWATDNATLTLNGSGGELVRDGATGVWRARNDNGARIERLTGAANGDNDGEYWKVTTQDGTQYFFGLNRLPGWASGNPVTNSVWTVPVYGNHSGEPCRQSTFDASHCAQVWRWNLDHVIDRHGDTMSYFYTPETNKYARNLDPAKASTYTRGGVLEHIEYGQRDGAVYTTPAVGKVLFSTADRCVPGTTCVKTDKAHFPDVPYDLECTGSTCPDKFTPSFWTAKRLASVTTQVRDGAGFRDVDRWALRHSYPDPGDGTRPGLWLDGITHTGLLGGSAAMPEVTFSGVQMPNRVDGIDNIPAMNWWRISAIHSETGGEMAITYSGPDCSAPSDLPVPDTNTRRCMPVRWTPEGLSERLDWFHKYVVTQVTEHDRTSGLQPVVTNYEYVGGAAWRYAEADGITQEKYKTWSGFRGYGRVITRVGHPADGPVTRTETLYLRGMHGDKKAAGGTKSVQVTASEFGPINDEEPLAGFTRETISYVGDTTTVLSRVINDPWLSTPTATAVHPWGTNRAYVQGTAAVHGRQTMGDGTIRRTRSNNILSTVNGRQGVLTATDDLGDESTAADDKCVRTEYADNTGRWLIGVITRVVTYSVSCTATATTADVMTDTRDYYDDNTTLGALDVGNLTRSEKLVSWTGSTPVYETTNRAAYDIHGRVVEAFDASDTRTTTTFTPLTGGPVTRVVANNELDHAVTTDLEPAWGVTKATTDPNGRTAQAEYDPLGRVVKVWQPGRTRGVDSPDVEYAYLIRTDGPNVITTRSLKHDGTYITSFQLLDGQARERQTQEPAPGGGRIVTDTIYNSRGEVAATNGPYYNDAPPGFSVLIPDPAQLPARTETVYDGAGRATVSIFKVQGVEQWRSSTTYGGDRVSVTPPPGGTATTTITDVRGQATELRQYHGSTPTGTYDATRYTYTKRGEVSTVTDPVGNVWRYFYNLRGQKERDEDPDRGAVTYAYDDASGELRSTTDARGRTVAYVYDSIGRRTALHDGSAAGPKLAEWVYDTLAKGHLTSSTRFAGGAAYKREVTGYDAGYRPTGARVTIPGAEGSLAGTYEYTMTYHGDGSQATATMPAVGGLPAETMTFGYDSAFSLPTSISSNLGSYVTNSTYTPYGEPWQVTTSTDATGATKWVTTTFEYHVGTRRLGRVLVERDGSPMRLSNATYSWDPAGNLTKVVDQATGVATDTQCFKYDYLRRLTTAWTPLSGSCTAAPSAAGLGSPAPYYHAWSFDKTGNRLSQTKHATAGNTVSTSTYPAPTAAQPHTLRSVTTTGPSGNRLDQYTYDAAGNTLTRNLAGATQTLEWDVEGRLAKVTEPGRATTFLYDADGTRLLRKDPGGTTLYLGPDEVFQNPAGTITCTRYYSHQGRTIAVRASGAGNGTLHWLGADHHGTNSIAVKAADMSVQRRYSTPYGEPRGAEPASWPGEKGFVGGTKDASTGLTHLGAREYDPMTGRFASVDPIIDVNDPQQMNGYAYASNMPTSASDPDGLRVMTDEEWYGVGYDSKPYVAPTPAKSQPAPPPKKCKPWDVICKGKQTVKKVGDAAKAVGNWVVEHKTTILTVAASVAAGVACGIVTAGAAAVACAVGAGMLIGAAEYHFTTPPDKRSLGGYFGAAAIGGATSLLGAGVGKLAGAAIKAGAKALGQGAKEVVKAAGKAAVEEAKSMAKGAANAAKNMIKGGGRNGGKGGAGGGGGRGGIPDCDGNSFAPGTPVLLAGGGTKAIEDIALGDKVLAADPATGQAGPRSVARTITGHGDKQLVRITVDVDGAAGSATATLTATDGHPFWLPDDRVWLDAGDLQPGQALVQPDGAQVTVLAVVAYGAVARVHNLTVEGIHTYYVLAGGSPVLVHNCSVPGSAPLSVREVAEHILSSHGASKVIVIGRTMDRVRAATRALRAEGVTDARWYQAWTLKPFNPSIAMARNTRWIRTKMKQGYTIVDIGPDLGRSDPFGPFYGMELRETARYGTHLMSWPSS